MLLWMAILTYLISGAVATYALYKGKKVNNWALYTFAIVGLLSHSAALLSEIYTAGMLSFSLLNALSICVWMVVAVVLVSSSSKPLQNLFPFVMPFGAGLLFLGMLTPQPEAFKIYNSGMVAHIFLALLAYSVMAVATVQALLVSYQNRCLHNHQIRNRISEILPPLQTMERLMFEWVLVGFLLLTLAVATGAIYIENFFAQHLIHKTVLTIIAWCFFFYVLIAHYFLGVRGLIASRLIYIGFSFLIIGFVGSKFVLEYLLQ
ncbi:cytochrome c biogenesis protein CcsA [Reinekea marina]|uniref:Inner membrane protein YpjD n=1 Tax=Reinekea marina TaxID=1310421 RepID=A0ABV7WPC3_9GAMM|nr:cytochrome c biogenesis protein CcsA [Reinekea marina]MDN3649871.1 cytochrome c biogenesis protein CcsA [Reinekea marina]